MWVICLIRRDYHSDGCQRYERGTVTSSGSAITRKDAFNRATIMALTLLSDGYGRHDAVQEDLVAAQSHEGNAVIWLSEDLEIHVFKVGADI